MTEDFAYNPAAGVFEDAPSTSVLSDVVIICNTKCASFAKTNGRADYPGDWFMFPETGHSCYEIKTVSDEAVNEVKRRLEIALKPVLNDSRVIGVSVNAYRKPEESHRIYTVIDVVEKTDSFSYEYFVEVM